MLQEEMESILQSFCPREQTLLDAPTADDWRRLESRFGCQFGDDFKTFIYLMSKYQFPGEILNVSRGNTNGNDSIEVAFDVESLTAVWDPVMLPFYAIGNGDYFCLDIRECPDSRVLYFYSDRQVFETYLDSFEEWIRQLPGFIS